MYAIALIYNDGARIRMNSYTAVQNECSGVVGAYEDSRTVAVKTVCAGLR
jgi:hypothetical protein